MSFKHGYILIVKWSNDSVEQKWFADVLDAQEWLNSHKEDCVVLDRGSLD